LQPCRQRQVPACQPASSNDFCGAKFRRSSGGECTEKAFSKGMV
jgi:hypothetical protein